MIKVLRDEGEREAGREEGAKSLETIFLLTSDPSTLYSSRSEFTNANYHTNSTTALSNSNNCSLTSASSVVTSIDSNNSLVPSIEDNLPSGESTYESSLSSLSSIDTSSSLSSLHSPNNSIVLSTTLHPIIQSQHQQNNSQQSTPTLNSSYLSQNLPDKRLVYEMDISTLPSQNISRAHFTLSSRSSHYFNISTPLSSTLPPPHPFNNTITSSTVTLSPSPSSTHNSHLYSASPSPSLSTVLSKQRDVSSKNDGHAQVPSFIQNNKVARKLSFDAAAPSHQSNSVNSTSAPTCPSFSSTNIFKPPVSSEKSKVSSTQMSVNHRHAEFSIICDDSNNSTSLSSSPVFTHSSPLLLSSGAYPFASSCSSLASSQTPTRTRLPHSPLTPLSYSSLLPLPDFSQLDERIKQSPSRSYKYMPINTCPETPIPMKGKRKRAEENVDLIGEATLFHYQSPAKSRYTLSTIPTHISNSSIAEAEDGDESDDEIGGSSFFEKSFSSSSSTSSSSSIIATSAPSSPMHVYPTSSTFLNNGFQVRTSDFDIIRVLGKGSYSIVSLVKKKTKPKSLSALKEKRRKMREKFQLGADGIKNVEEKKYDSDIEGEYFALKKSKLPYGSITQKNKIVKQMHLLNILTTHPDTPPNFVFSSPVSSSSSSSISSLASYVPADTDIHLTSGSSSSTPSPSHSYLIPYSPPHLLRHYAVWQEGGLVYYQTDACQTDCSHYFSRQTSPQRREDDVWRLLFHVSQPLLRIASLNMCHMDVKPSNILVDKQSSFVLGDLGSLTLISDWKEDEGDGHYLAPEVLNDKHISTAVDVYALGATLYACVTGLFVQPALEDSDCILNFKDVWFPISTELTGLIRQMTRKNPSLRPSMSVIGKIAKEHWSGTNQPLDISSTDIMEDNDSDIDGEENIDSHKTLVLSPGSSATDTETEMDDDIQLDSQSQPQSHHQL